MAGVFGVVSTFRPDAAVVQRAREHSRQVDKLIVVDDGSPDSRVLDELSGPEFEIIRLAENSGIAIALNTGITAAIAGGAEYIVNLDQDTVLDAGYVAKCLATFASAATATHLGLVLADCVNHQPSIPPRYSPEGFGLVEEGIQSGMIVRADCLRDVGLLDERLFIDCVDIEFCLRMGDRGWRIAVAPGSNITHSLGDMVAFRPFGMQRMHGGEPALYQYHAPFRQYYITRNNIDLVLRNVGKRPRWVLQVMKRETGPHLKAMVGGPHRAKQWLAIGVGGIHGLVRRRGKIPSWLAKAVRTS